MKDMAKIFRDIKREKDEKENEIRWDKDYQSALTRKQ